MDVTRANFQEVLSELDDVLEDATFLSIDGEFTGLNSGPDASAFDTPSQYYSKLLNGSMDFLLVQFGLSVFTYNNENNKYSQRSYNFYVFPKPFNRSAPDCRFLCQASSITFLANRGFDFNKLFTEGIPYLTRNEEDILNKKMEEKQKMREEGLDYIHISDDDRPQIEDICTRIENFLEADADELQIDKCNAFIRRLVYQETKVRWPNKVRVETINDNGNQYIIIYKLGTEEEEEKRKLEKIEREKQEVQDAVGLSALLRKIADSGKVLIGHNMLLDLCHIIHQFFGPLPQSYTEFKSLVHGLFPQIYDTKIICQLSPFKDSVPSILNYLFDTVSISPFSLPEVEMIKDRSYTINKDKLHEAGYDAFITGLCFIAMCDRLGALQNPKIDRVLANSPILQPYLNKLLIARLKDYPYIHLTGKDPNPSRDHVFHITFSKDWRYSDLAQLFMPYGGAFISWLSDTTAYVGLHKKEQAKSVIKDLFKAKNYSLQKYAEHQACLNNKKSVNSERKRKMYDNPSSPEKSPSPKDSETSSSTKKQDDDGWEVATGKKNLDKNSDINKKSQSAFNPKILNQNLMYMLLFGTVILIISLHIGLNYNQSHEKANSHKTNLL